LARRGRYRLRLTGIPGEPVWALNPGGTFGRYGLAFSRAEHSGLALTVDAGSVLGANAVATAGSLTMGSSLKGDRFQAHVTATLNCPFIILFERQRADEAPGRPARISDARNAAARNIACASFTRAKSGDVLSGLISAL
jgi:hypothetical protein